MKKWILVLIVPAMIVVGCGGSDDSGSGDGGSGSSGGSSAAAVELFSDNCAGCHTLSEADADGQLGPELDGTSLSVERVHDQIENGGGSMPAFKDQLSPEEIDQLAEFVSESSQS